MDKANGSPADVNGCPSFPGNRLGDARRWKDKAVQSSLVGRELLKLWKDKVGDEVVSVFVGDVGTGLDFHRKHGTLCPEAGLRHSSNVFKLDVNMHSIVTKVRPWSCIFRSPRVWYWNGGIFFDKIQGVAFVKCTSCPTPGHGFPSGPFCSWSGRSSRLVKLCSLTTYSLIGSLPNFNDPPVPVRGKVHIERVKIDIVQ